MDHCWFVTNTSDFGKAETRIVEYLFRNFAILVPTRLFLKVYKHLIVIVESVYTLLAVFYSLMVFFYWLVKRFTVLNYRFNVFLVLTRSLNAHGTLRPALHQISPEATYQIESTSTVRVVISLLHRWLCSLLIGLLHTVNSCKESCRHFITKVLLTVYLSLFSRCSTVGDIVIHFFHYVFYLVVFFL